MIYHVLWKDTEQGTDQSLPGGAHVIIEIESYKGDTLLYGQKVSFGMFQKQIEAVKSLYDRKEDNFVTLLCSVTGKACVIGGTGG